MSRARTPGLVALWILVALLAIRFGFLAAHAATRQTGGFAAYYTSADLIQSRNVHPPLYDDSWFEAQVSQRFPRVKDVYFVNPPTTSILFVSLTWLTPREARIAWTVLDVALLMLALGWIVREARLGSVELPVFLAVALAFQPVAANFEEGQVYVLLSLLLVACWHGYRRGREAQLGLALGLLLILKTAAPLLALLILAQRRSSALAIGGVTALVVALAALPWTGVDLWNAYLRQLAGLNARPELAVTAYQTPTSLIRHLLSFDVIWNPAPLVNAPLLARWLPLLAALALVGVTLLPALRRTASDELTFAATIVAGLVISPVSLDYHYTLLLLPIALLIVAARSQPWSTRALLGIGIAAVAFGAPYHSPALSSGARALLAYPKLYGALLLWVLSLTWNRAPSEVRRESRDHPTGLQRQRV